MDPEARSLEVYRLENGHGLQMNTHVGEVRVHAEPFEVLALELGRLWKR